MRHVAVLVQPGDACLLHIWGRRLVPLQGSVIMLATPHAGMLHLRVVLPAPLTSQPPLPAGRPCRHWQGGQRAAGCRDLRPRHQHLVQRRAHGEAVAIRTRVSVLHVPCKLLVLGFRQRGEEHGLEVWPALMRCCSVACPASPRSC